MKRTTGDKQIRKRKKRQSKWNKRERKCVKERIKKNGKYEIVH